MNVLLLSSEAASRVSLAVKTTAIGWAGSNQPSGAREEREGFMTYKVSRRGKQIPKTAQTLLRAAQAMTDGVIAAHLGTLAADCNLRAVKASHVDAGKAFARSATSVERE